MSNKIKLVSFFFSALILHYSGYSNADTSPAWDKLASLANIHSFELQHKPNNKDKQLHHIFVKLPNDYDENKEATYPTLYLLDGDTNFPLIASYYHYLHFVEDVPSMIIVGLSYGSFDWRKGNNRSHDYTVPSKEAEHWGGASKFEKFLSASLLPEMKKRFRVDEKQQILFGQSLSGQFALYSAMYGSAPFYAVIASNPAFHRNLDYFKQDAKQRDDRPQIFITSAEFDDERFKKPLNNWHSHWSKANADWQYSFTHLPRHNHLSATPESVRVSLKTLFSLNSENTQ